MFIDYDSSIVKIEFQQTSIVLMIMKILFRFCRKLLLTNLFNINVYHAPFSKYIKMKSFFAFLLLFRICLNYIRSNYFLMITSLGSISNMVHVSSVYSVLGSDCFYTISRYRSPGRPNLSIHVLTATCFQLQNMTCNMVICFCPLICCDTSVSVFQKLFKDPTKRSVTKRIMYFSKRFALRCFTAL